ncbi:hypothetical protein [Kribbella sp. NPDC051718]|uniref:hypothetical protein n=1 Tax=Kribbella sp. NPDC051718 TaxID=3155168 RepID=UPI003417A15D
MATLRIAVGEELVADIPATRADSLGTANLAQLGVLENALVAEEAAISAARQRDRTARARSALAAELDSLQIELPALRFRGTNEPRAESRPAAAPQLVRRLQAVLDLATELDDSLQGDLRRLAEVVADPAAAPAKALGFLTEMEARVTAATNRQRAQERLTRRVEELGYAFADLLSSKTEEGLKAHVILENLTGRPDQVGIDAAVRRFGELDRSRAAAADRRFAVEQATAVLREMGYAVEVGPVGADGELVALASTQAWPHHGLRLVFPAGRAGLHTIPVAFDDTDVRDDVAFEESSCGDVDRLRQGLSERGVPTDLTHHVAPGGLAVRRETRSAAARTATPAVRKRKL